MRKNLCLIVMFSVVVFLTGCFSPNPMHVILDLSSDSVEQDSELIENENDLTKTHNDIQETPEQVSDGYMSWALGCSAIMASSSSVYDPYEFGMGKLTESFAENTRIGLLMNWNISDRDDLIATIERMTHNGHNVRFAEAYTLVKESGFDSTSMDIFDEDEFYMWQLTKTIGDKWDDKQILAWDWFRMIHLAVWGYAAGYIEVEESCELMAPIIELLRENFSSWEEACENYLDGYAWWSRTDVSESNTEYQWRVSVYEDIKNDEILFDPSVWEPEWSIE